MNSDEKFRKWQKRLQPGRNGLLINREWGTPLEKYSRAEATEKGLKAWNNRWVGESDLRVLKQQYLAYRRIKMIAALIAGIGLFVLLRAPEKIGQIQPGIPGLVAAGSVLLYPLFHFAVAWGIANYKNPARWTAVVLYPLLIPPRTLYVHQHSEIGGWYMIVLSFFIFIMVGFFSKTARVIFASGSEERKASAAGAAAGENVEF